VISYPVVIRLEVCDIRCWATVTAFRPGDPGRLFGPPEFCYPPEPPEFEFFLSHRKNGPYSITLNDYIREADWYDLHEQIEEQYHD
jgi:hypothetical protein